MWHESEHAEPEFTDTLSLDLSSVKPSMAGPKRPQDRVELDQLIPAFDKLLIDANRVAEKTKAHTTQEGLQLHHGDVVIAAITSCTNTSNPSVLMAAGLLAKKALEKGLTRKPWVNLRSPLAHKWSLVTLKHPLKQIP